MITVASILMLLAQLGLAQSPHGLVSDSVTVSRRALTVSFAFPSDSLAKRRESTLLASVMLIPGSVDLVRTFRLTVVEPVSPAAYRHPIPPVSCWVMTDTYSCRDSAAVEVTNGRLVITIRDSAMLALVFDDRPIRMTIRSALRPLDMGSVVVRYVDPQLLLPSKEALAEYDRALGRDGWGPWTRMLWTSSFAALDSVWMQVGDRITAYMGEMQCRPIDSCRRRSDFAASGWTSSDASVAVLEVPKDARHVSATIVALRPGRSTVAVEGLHGPSDDLPRSTHTVRLVRHIVVTDRLARVQITPRPTMIVAGSDIKFEAHLIDDAGAVVADAPINFSVIYDWPDNKDWGSKRYDLATRANLTTPGHRRFIARFANLADTLDVQVVPR